MSPEHFDTIVVGARCAGAPLATHLARAGQKVLLLDAAKLPSDHPLSTHFISPVGVEFLDDLGVGPEVRRLCPPSRRTRLDLDGTTLDVAFQRSRAGHCLRRLRLDPLLQEAAVNAGAELRDKTKVVGLLREGAGERGRVVGVEALHEGERREYWAPLVVGADGHHSTVAELAGAKEYLGYDSPRFGYWGYFPASAAWKSGAYPFDAYIGFSHEQHIRFVFQTDEDLLLLGVTPLHADLPSWRGRHEEAYLEAMRCSPVTAPLVEGNQRVGKLIGLLSGRFFFREATGPGFALVGDAGLHKDPTPGYGITDALRDARNLSRAILSSGDRDAGLLRYWRQRDVDSIDLFHFARSMADPGYLNPLNRVIYQRAQSSPEICARMAAQADREISPYEVLRPSTAIRWVAGAALRGNLAVLPAFFAVGKRNAEIQRVRSERIALLQ